MVRSLVLVLATTLVCLISATSAATDKRGRPSKQQSDGRIVGGVETPITNFAFQVSLSRNGVHACGGSIIHERLVLTAAHCIPDPRLFIYQIRAGSSEHLRGGVVRQVVQIMTHENYNHPTTLNNDIAILVLNEKLPFNTHIRPINVASEAELSSPEISFFVSGWGATSSAQQQTVSHLRYTVVQKIDHDACKSAYRSFAPITETMMCAGTATGGRDSCQGDSGGPLTIKSNGQLKLAGIVSWGIGCAHQDFPGVYTQVFTYIDWIKQKASSVGIS